MAGITFHCPNTGFYVHAWTEGEDSETNHIYKTVTCTACQRVHLVNPKSGRVVGDDNEE
jgi:hypothetical protein